MIDLIRAAMEQPGLTSMMMSLHLVLSDPLQTSCTDREVLHGSEVAATLHNSLHLRS